MKTLIIAFYTLSALALSSPFPSTVEGITIKNTHSVDESGSVYRGQAPLGKIQELIDFGITDILIFKNQTRSEVDQEYNEIASKDAHHINVSQLDFLWHDYPSYSQACNQMISALKIIKEVYKSNDRKIFFHCTVGEDRTGALAGLWRMLASNYSIKRAFYYEMCENGYGKGNPNKPFYVYNEIRQDLTPLFIYMGSKIESGELTLDNLTPAICNEKMELSFDDAYKCRESSKYPTN